MDDEGIWAPSIADLPGVTYTAPSGITRPRVPKGQATPQVSQHEYDGESRSWLSWKTRGGTTSASPASRHFSNQRGKASSVEAILDELHQGLLKPGTPSDYHFALQHVIDELWRRRRSDPTAIPPLEALCLLDIAVVEAFPSAFRSGESFYAMTAPRLLVRLYENAGDLDAAVTLARRVDPFLNGTGELDRLEAKHVLLCQEEAP